MLTDADCKNATCPPEKKRVRLTDSGGLYLEVSPNRSRRWFWKFRKGASDSRVALGSYPDVSLKAARLARDKAKHQRADGIDLGQARKLEKLKLSNPAGDTFKVVALEWFAKQEAQWSEATSLMCKMGSPCAYISLPLPLPLPTTLLAVLFVSFLRPRGVFSLSENLTFVQE